MAVDDSRAEQWERDAREALARFYGVALALLHERESLLAYIERVQRRPEQPTEAS